MVDYSETIEIYEIKVSEINEYMTIHVQQRERSFLRQGPQIHGH